MADILQNLDYNRIRDDLYSITGKFPYLMWGFVLPLAVALSSILSMYDYMISYIEHKKFMEMIDKTENNEDKNVQKALVSKEEYELMNPGKQELDLNSYEMFLLPNVIKSNDIEVGFKDIAGLEKVIEKIEKRILLPIILPSNSILTSGIITSPSGSLLFGPPGVGKTMLAKAMAKESEATFINVDISQLINKWVGESEKNVKAIFTLAKKLQPSIIFLDEIDSLLQTRQDKEHMVSRNIKALFLQQMDGLMTSHTDKIIVIGATNQKDVIDPAILRRMPVTFHIDLPNVEQREAIFRKHLNSLKNVDHKIDINQLALRSNGFSGSKIKDICQGASIRRINCTVIRAENSRIKEKYTKMTIKPLTVQDLLEEMQEDPEQSHMGSNSLYT